MMTSILDARGFGMAEMMIGVSALMIGVVGIMTVSHVSSNQHREVAFKSKVLEIKSTLMSTIANQAAWEKTIEKNGAGSMKCLLTKTCANGTPTAGSRRFVLYNADGNVVYDPTVANAGFMRNGVPCSAIAGSAMGACPVTIDLEWHAVCDDAVPLSCQFPTEMVSVIFKFNESTRLNANTLSVRDAARQSLGSETPFSRCISQSKFFVGKDQAKFRDFDIDANGCVSYKALQGPQGPQGPIGFAGPEGPVGPMGDQGMGHIWYNLVTPIPTATP